MSPAHGHVSREVCHTRAISAHALASAQGVVHYYRDISFRQLSAHIKYFKYVDTASYSGHFLIAIYRRFATHCYLSTSRKATERHMPKTRTRHNKCQIVIDRITLTAIYFISHLQCCTGHITARSIGYHCFELLIFDAAEDVM
jgi:hypothetical protein